MGKIQLANLDFYVRVRVYEKRVTGKQLLHDFFKSETVIIQFIHGILIHNVIKLVTGYQPTSLE